jgi:hypothetical protein
MPLIEFQTSSEGKIKARLTDQEYVPSELDQAAAKMGVMEIKNLEAQWDKRRARFFEWALENPKELDMLLDEVDSAGILYGYEYND